MLRLNPSLKNSNRRPKQPTRRRRPIMKLNMVQSKRKENKRKKRVKRKVKSQQRNE
jgi:hypothetical protein